MSKMSTEISTDSVVSIVTRPNDTSNNDEGTPREEAIIDQVHENSTSNLDNRDREKRAEESKAIHQTKSIPTDLTGQFFSIFFFGSIEHGYFDKTINDVYFKYNVVYGSDWVLGAGLDIGISQLSRRRTNTTSENVGGEFVWNLPIDCSFRSYNPYGWPQIVLSVYYFDTFGQDVVLGYGCIHLPVSHQLPTMHKRRMIIYAPESSSLTRKFFSWLTGRRPELINPKLFANGDCRQVLHMKSVGHIDLVMNATFRDMIKHRFRH